MPARLPVTGPAELFVAPTPAGPYVFFGTDESEPHIQIIPTLSPVYNDYGGEVPFDYMYHGSEAVVAMNLNRWDELVYLTLANRPSHGAVPTGIPGLNVFGDVGQLEVQNGVAFSVIVNFPFFGALNNVAAGMPPGYRFFACELVGPDDMKVGTRTQVLQVVIKAMRVFVPRSGAQIPGSVVLPGTVSGGSFSLYDNFIPALPAPT